MQRGVSGLGATRGPGRPFAPHQVARLPLAPRTARLPCICAAAPEGGLPSSGLSAVERIKKAILGYPSAEDASKASPSKGAAPHPAAAAAAAAAPASEAVVPGSWEWWSAYFDAMDDTVRELDGLDSELEGAVRAEDYARAAEVRAAIRSLEAHDDVAAVLEGMEAALEEERYSDAAALRDGGGAGLLGWWVGRGEGDMHGHLVRVTPDFGRYVGHAYTGTSIAELTGWSDEPERMQDSPFSASSSSSSVLTVNEEAEAPPPSDNGTPVFEVFVRRDAAAGGFLQQAAALHAPYGALPTGAVDDISQLLAAEIGTGATVSVERGQNEDGVDFVRINVTAGGNSDDDPPAGDEDDAIRTIDDLAALFDLDSGERDGEESSGEEGPQGTVTESFGWGMIGGGEEVIDISGEGDEAGARLPLGADADQAGSAADTLSSMGLGVMAHRVAAGMEWHGRDTFVLDILEPPEREPDQGQQQESGSSSVVAVEEGKGPEGGEASSSAAGAGEGGRGEFSGRLDDLESLVRTAMGEAIAQGIGAIGAGPEGGVMGLRGRFTYTRLPPNDCPTDPFTGVYLGTFGPHGPELLQVSRVTLEGEEWVQGVKLTGDPNVPAGKVSFRAKIGRSSRLSPDGTYPPEFGVQQRFRGEGRVAKEGYASAKWVEGELLTFSAVNPLTRGAELGFVYNMDASRRYLLLFTKVDMDRVIPEEVGA